MSVKLMSLVWDSSYAKTTPGKLLVMLKLADNAQDDGGSCYPSQNTIAEKCNLSRSYVNRVIQDLEKDGKLTIERIVMHGGKFKNTYQLFFRDLDRDVNSVDILPDEDVNSGEEGCELSTHTNVNSVDTNHKRIINEPSDITSSFGLWKQTFTLNGNTKLTDVRSKLIEKRLKQYGVETVGHAIQGCALSAWHVSNGQTSIEIILSINQNRNNVEKFAQLWLDGQSIPTLTFDDQKMRESLQATQEMFYGR